MASNYSLRRNWSLVFVIIMGAGLFFYTNYRAATLSITHDEGVVYKLIQEHSSLDIFNYIIPQDHMINTLMMKWSCSIFPDTEYALRLPNLIGHLIYIIFSILLLIRLKNPNMLVAGFILLNFNPYLLDFFSIARGYGLSTSFMMASLYFIYSFNNTKRIIHLFFGFFFSVLAVLTVYTLINYLLAIYGFGFIMLAVYLIQHRFRIEPRFKALLGVSILIYTGTAALLYLLLSGPLQRVQAEEFIYQKFEANFYTGTLRPIVFRSIYNSDPGLTVDMGSIGIIIGYVLSLLIMIYLAARRDFSFLSRLLFFSFIVSLIVAASISTQNELFNVRYLRNRTATFIAPLIMLTIIGLLDELRRFKYLKVASVGAAYLLAILFSLNLARNGNFQKYLEWDYDASTKKMMKDLCADTGGAPNDKAEMGIIWLYEPSINFYRTTWKLDWLKEVNRDGYMGDFDYYYVIKADSILGKELFRDKTIIAEYPLSNTVLIRK